VLILASIDALEMRAFALLYAENKDVVNTF
jgi:hypothetical protein